MRSLFVTTWALFFSFLATAGEALEVPTKSHDPALLCSTIEKKLPDKLSSIRRVGNLRSENVKPDTDYCDHQAKDCEIHALHFPGMELHLLANKRTQHASVLTTTISTPQWRFLGSIRVGEKLEALEDYFGVTIPRDISPVVLQGECAPLTVWHTDGRVMQFLLDCQACI